jgi:hypothetical protein
MAWLQALMMATGWPAGLAQLRDQRIVAAVGDAPGLGTGSFAEAFHNTPKPALTAASAT